MDIITRVRQFVESECEKPTSKYGYEPFLNHFVPTVEYAIQLAEKHGADVEVVTVAAWLHDVGSIANGRENHHISGAEIASKKLEEFGYVGEKIQLVRKCILRHRGSQRMSHETLEEQIVAEADAMSAFCNIAGLFAGALVDEKRLQEAARLSVIEKLKNKWGQLRLDGSRDLIRPMYEAAMLLLRG